MVHWYGHATRELEVQSLETVKHKDRYLSYGFLEPTQPPIQWVPETISLVVKRREREADHSPPYNAEVKESAELYLHSPTRLHGVVLS